MLLTSGVRGWISFSSRERMRGHYPSGYYQSGGGGCNRESQEAFREEEDASRKRFAHVHDLDRFACRTLVLWKRRFKPHTSTGRGGSEVKLGAWLLKSTLNDYSQPRLVCLPAPDTIKCGDIGVPRSKETAPPEDPTLGLCLGPYSGPMGWELFLVSEVSLQGSSGGSRSGFKSLRFEVQD